MKVLKPLLLSKKIGEALMLTFQGVGASDPESFRKFLDEYRRAKSTPAGYAFLEDFTGNLLLRFDPDDLDTLGQRNYVGRAELLDFEIWWDESRKKGHFPLQAVLAGFLEDPQSDALKWASDKWESSRKGLFKVQLGRVPKFPGLIKKWSYLSVWAFGGSAMMPEETKRFLDRRHASPEKKASILSYFTRTRLDVLNWEQLELLNAQFSEEVSRLIPELRRVVRQRVEMRRPLYPKADLVQAIDVEIKALTAEDQLRAELVAIADQIKVKEAQRDDRSLRDKYNEKKSIKPETLEHFKALVNARLELKPKYAMLGQDSVPPRYEDREELLRAILEELRLNLNAPQFGELVGVLVPLVLALKDRVDGRSRGVDLILEAAENTAVGPLSREELSLYVNPIIEGSLILGPRARKTFKDLGLRRAVRKIFSTRDDPAAENMRIRRLVDSHYEAAQTHYSVSSLDNEIEALRSRSRRINDLIKKGEAGMFSRFDRIKSLEEERERLLNEIDSSIEEIRKMGTNEAL